MDNTENIKQLKDGILSGQVTDRQKSIDKLIELEGMKSMDFFQSIFLKDPFHSEEGTAELHNAAGYGVRQLMELRANESKSEFKFCPYCAAELFEYEILDPFMIGLNCSNNHYFHIEVKQGECKDKSLSTEKTKPIDIAKEWLANKNLRKEYQNQVAEILRKYVDLNESDKNNDEQNHPNRYCPICSLPLQEFKQDDVWVKGLNCSNNHIFYERNGLSYQNSQLKPDITKATFDFLVTSYLQKDQSEHLPNQVVELLTTISKEVK